MATHDYVIDNSTGANVRSDINNVLQAILTNNSSSSAPSTTAAYMWWADTTTGILKIRNSANDGWVELLQLDGTLTLEDGSASTPALAFRDDLNTGIFSSGADKINFATGGVERLELGGETVFNEDGANVDFRIEGDSQQNLFHVDAGNDRIGFGTAAPSGFLHAITSQTTVAILESTDGGNSGVSLVLRHTTGSPADNDAVGTFSFQAQSDGGSNHTYGTITATAQDVSDGSEDAEITMTTSTAGSATEKFRLDASGIRLQNLEDGAGISINQLTTTGQHGSILFNSNRTGDFDNVGFIRADWNSDSVASINLLAGNDTSNKDNGKITFKTQPDNSTGLLHRMLINEDGQVLIGGTSNAGAPNTNERFIVFGNASNNSRIAVVAQHNDDNPATVIIAKSRSTGNAILGNNDDVGQLDFAGNDGSGFHVMARIACTASGQDTSNDDLPSVLRFFTLAENTATCTERMRIHKDGELSLQTTSLNLQGGGASDFMFTVLANTGSNHNAIMAAGVASGHGAFTTRPSGAHQYFAGFFLENGGSGVGSISVGTSSTTFNTTSDYRLKENAVNISDGITRLKQLLPKRFNWIADETNTLQDGFFAHEVSAIVPEAVTGEKDAVATEDGGQYTKGEPIYQQMDHSKLVPLLVAAVKELITKVETLEAA